MEPDMTDSSIDIQVIDKMMDRWRGRLLAHGATSQLGMEASRQLVKLEARKEHLNAKD